MRSGGQTSSLLCQLLSKRIYACSKSSSACTECRAIPATFLILLPSGLLLSCTAVFGRLYNNKTWKQFWILRLNETSRGRLICFNAVLLWGIFNIVFCILVLVFLNYSVHLLCDDKRDMLLPWENMFNQMWIHLGFALWVPIHAVLSAVRAVLYRLSNAGT